MDQESLQQRARGSRSRLAFVLTWLALALLPRHAQAALAPYVRSVEYVDIQLTTGAAVSVPLTKGQTIANCVPFVSSQFSNLTDFNTILADVWFTAGPNVTAQKSGNGTVNLGVFVVEFEPTMVKVQQGVMSLAASGGTSTLNTSTIAAVTQGNAAMAFYYRSADASSDWIYHMVAGWFSADTTLSFQRDAAQGAITGHYYVFEALSNEFTVQARSLQIASGGTAANVAINPVAMNKTFVIASHRTNRQKDEPTNCSPQVWLSATNQIDASRFGNDSYTVDIRAFAVTFAGDELVERGFFDYAQAELLKDFTLATPVDTNQAIAWNGVMRQGSMADDDDQEPFHHAAFQRLQLTLGGTRVQGDRGGQMESGKDGTNGRWEVISFIRNPSITLADHASGQAPDRFTNTASVTDTLFRFRLVRFMTATVDAVRVRFTTSAGVASGDVTGGELWVDVNGDGAVDGGDTLVEGGVAAAAGMLTFRTDVVPATNGTSYLVRATVANLIAGDATTFLLDTNDVDVVESGVSKWGAVTAATHTQDGIAGGDIYYSVGTSAADFKTAGSTISISSGVATLSLPQTGTMGLGDMITYNGATIAYIKAVLSPTQFVVQTRNGGVPPNVSGQTVNSIRRAFNTIAAAESGSTDGAHLGTNDLTSGGGFRLTWVCYNDGPFSVGATTTINGYVADATHYITLTVAGASDVVNGVSQRHSGVAGTGVVVELTAPLDPVFDVDEPHTRIEWLEVDGNDLFTAGAGSLAFYVNTAGDHALLQYLLLHHLSSETTAPQSNGTGIVTASTLGFETIRNSFIHDFDEDGIAVGSPNVTIQNCTIFRTRKLANGGEGVQLGGAPASATATNVISMVNALPGMALSNDFFVNGGGVLTCNSCISGDGTADDFGGSGNQVNRLYTRQFVSITSYADLHLRPGADALHAGQSLAAFFADDIDAGTRPIGPGWDVGADEAMLWSPTFLMQVGSYQGDGANDRVVHVGFQPDFVLIDSQAAPAAANAVIRTSTMAGDATKEIDPGGATALGTLRIKSLTTTGFTVGTNADVNSSTGPPTYHWVAMRASTGAMKVGSYTGNGTTQTISGLGFTPVYVIVIPAANQNPIQRLATMPPSFSQDFLAFAMNDGITGFRSDGFVVGANARANTNGAVYHYVAWAVVPGRIAVGSYLGDGTNNRAITGTGFQPKWLTHTESYANGTVGAQGNAPAHKPATTGIATDLSLLYNTNATSANNFKALQPDGFLLGNDGRVNSATAPNAYHWAAFGPHTGGVNYRSISSRPHYTSGTVTATNGSRVVDASVGVQWLTNNRGRGDRIVFTADGGQNAYTVEAVLSETQLLLTYPYQGTTGGSKPYSLQRKFVGMWDWERCIQASQACGTATWGETAAATNSLVADDRSEVGIAYRDVGFPSANRVAADGSFIPACGSGCEVLWLFEDAAVATDASHTVTLTADGTNRHNGVAGTGVVFDNQGGDQSGITLNAEYATIEWIEVKRVNTPGEDGITINNINAGSGSTGASSITIRNMIIHDVADAGIEVTDGDVVVDAYNNVIYNSPSGVVVNAGTLAAWSRLRLFNNTLFNHATQGIRSNATVRPERLLLQNNIAWSGAGTNFSFAATPIDGASSHNLSRDGSDGVASPAGASVTVPLLASMAFQSTAGGSEDLHLQSGSAAAGAGTSLSGFFTTDIDVETRSTPWDIGADEYDGFTEVTLASFTARGFAASVLVEWKTAMELDNLGFHLYRGPTGAGPWQRLNTGLIPGLGSSPEGKAYSWTDAGLTNGVTWFYRLEDVDRSGRVTSHGPVSATPIAGAPAPEAGEPEAAEPDAEATAQGEWMAHGDPRDVSLREVERRGRSVVLELRTGGFYSQSQSDGSVRLHVPGFFATAEPGRPAMPVKRAWIDAVAGRGARIVSVRPADVRSFARLVPAEAGAPQAQAASDGTYRATFRRVRARPAMELFPSEPARILQTAFQQQAKRAYVELAPLRADGARGKLLLARRLFVTIAFDTRVEGETGDGGSRGRRQPRRRGDDKPRPEPEGEPDDQPEPEPEPSREVVARLVARASGLHAASWESLSGARALELRGASGIPASGLRLSRRGELVAFHVEPRTHRFGPGSTLYFLADDPETAYGTETVYELELAADGVQMPIAAPARGGSTGLLPALVETRVFEQNTNYLPALLNARDFWLWDYGLLAATGRDYAFTLGASSPATGPALLRIDLQGGSDATSVDPDHVVRVLVNGVPVGEAAWDGLEPTRFEARVDAAALLEGTNTLRIENLDTTGAFDSVVMLDRFALDHGRRLVAEGGRLSGRAESAGIVRAAGFPTGALVLDVSGRVPAWLAAEHAAGEVVFAAAAGASYLAVAPESVLRPEVRLAAPVTLRTPSHRADWIVIAPNELLPAVEPLVARRRSQGLEAMAVSLEQVQDEFGHGERSPQMLRAFLSHAYHSWAEPSVRYVLLVGDASYDPKGYIAAAARRNLLPTPIVRSTFLWTASDPSLAAVNGDDSIPDLAIGRLSAGSLAEAEASIAKILAFEESGQTLDGRAVMVADNPDRAGDFEANANDIASLLGGRSVEHIYLAQRGAQTRGAVLAAFDAGASLVSYVGHGSQALWASEGILRSIDVALLEPQARQPLMLTMTCSNGYFVSPFLNGIAERFVLEREKGAIAAFSPSGLSLDDAAHIYHRALVQQLAGARHERLGDLVLAAQQEYAASGAFPELLSIFHLFADPALRIR